MTQRGLSSFLARRAIGTLPMLLAVILINFSILSLIPGDAARVLAGDAASEEYVQGLRARMGLDRPFQERLLRYATAVLGGDLGYSLPRSSAVLDLIVQRLPATFLLLFTSLVVTAAGGIFLGLWAARRHGTWIDHGASALAAIGYALPTFWLGILLILVFAVMLRWFPVQGLTSLDVGDGLLARWTDLLWHITLPAIALGAYFLASIAKLTRTSMIEILSSDFVRTARAKGATERQVIFRHGLRNAAIPVITMIGYNATVMFGSAVMVETVFALPGLGRLTFEGILSRDLALLMGIIVVVSLFVVLVNLLTDVLYAVVDPHIRYA
jgi:peptide/nickel transport system permease protein